MMLNINVGKLETIHNTINCKEK